MKIRMISLLLQLDFLMNNLFQIRKTVNAVIRSLEIIGEAVKHIPSDFRKKYPEINWKNIAGMRDVLIHEYFGIDNIVLWSTVQDRIPELIDKIKLILDKYHSEQSRVNP
jgi:uncharacterized protein with HEPN domain